MTSIANVKSWKLYDLLESIQRTGDVELLSRPDDDASLAIVTLKARPRFETMGYYTSMGEKRSLNLMGQIPIDLSISLGHFNRVEGNLGDGSTVALKNSGEFSQQVSKLILGRVDQDHESLFGDPIDHVKSIFENGIRQRFNELLSLMKSDANKKPAN